jgi:hypothetical protein
LNCCCPNTGADDWPVHAKYDVTDLKREPIEAIVWLALPMHNGIPA